MPSDSVQELVLPNQFKLQANEKFVPISPDDLLPMEYHVGPTAPELSVTEINSSSEKHYWYDLQENIVKVAAVTPSKVDWIPCQMFKLVCDFSNEPVTILGKIVRMSDSADIVSFAEAMKLIRSKVSKSRNSVADKRVMWLDKEKEQDVEV